jgi:hypothetical protein
MKLAIVIPYRDRKAHLDRFLSHYSPLLPEADIYVIEQAEGKPFNRAKLFNVFFCEQGQNYDYYAFHDVDMYFDTLRTTIKVYDYPKVPNHLATCCEQFGYKMPYKGYFGGITLFNRKDFERSGGFSNNFWGWGGEDDEMRKNCIRKGLRPASRQAYYYCADHYRPVDPVQHKANVQRLRQPRQKNDGYKFCQYTILEKKSPTWYLVQL